MVSKTKNQYVKPPKKTQHSVNLIPFAHFHISTSKMPYECPIPPNCKLLTVNCQLLFPAKMFFYQSPYYRYQFTPFILHIGGPGILAYFVVMHSPYQEQLSAVQAHFKDTLMLQVLTGCFPFKITFTQFYTKRDFLITYLRHKPLFKSFTQYLNNRASLILAGLILTSLDIYQYIYASVRMELYMLRGCFLGVWLLIFGTAFGQTVTVEGIITDAKTNEPLIGAVVRIGDGGATTDVDGRFSIKTTLITGCKLTISYIGYRAVDIPCNPGQLFYNITLENDFVSLNDVQVKAKRLDVDDLLRQAIENIPKNYVSAQTAISGNYNLILHNETDTQLIATQPIFFYNNGGVFKNYFFNYSAYQEKGADIKIKRGQVTQKDVDHYIYNVLGRLTGKWDKYLRRFIDSKDEQETVISTFNILEDKYYDIVLISKNSKAIDEAALHGNRSGNEVLNKEYIWLREFRIHADAMAVTFYQEIMIESSADGYRALVALKDRNKIDVWLRKAMKGSATYTSYKLIFYRRQGKWQLRKESFRDSYWNPFNTDPRSKRVYYFEYEMGIPTKPPQEYEKFKPDISLKKYIAAD